MSDEVNDNDDKDFDLGEIEKRMNEVIARFSQELATIRTGKASPAMLDRIVVEAYGNKMPLNQCCSITVPESRMLLLNVWDKGMVTAVDKALRLSEFAFNPTVEGPIIRVIMPDLSEERRRDLVKVVGKYAEIVRVTIRGVRRDGMEQIKKLKNNGISEDEAKTSSDKVQRFTDKYVDKVDTMLVEKEKQIMQI
jgi:ribosome recycling factor